MIGRIAVAGIVLVALLGGAAMWWLQVHAFYERSEGGPVLLTTAEGQPVEAAPLSKSVIDADSSPLRYRACFAHAFDPADYAPHPDPTPLSGPGWFDCYDAAATGAAIASGEARAVIGRENITYGVDRVVALWPERGVAWHQLNPCGEAVFAGRPAPEGCPPPPEGYRD